MSAQEDRLAMMPWFPRDWVTATRLFTLAQRGAYADLLFFQWEMTRLPTEREALLRLLGCSASEFDAVWPVVKRKFVTDSQGMYNERLEAHRSKSKQLKSDKSLAGKLGGIKSGEARRSRREADTQAAPQAPACPSAASKREAPSPSPSPSISKIHTHTNGNGIDHTADAPEREPWEEADQLPRGSDPLEHGARFFALKPDYPPAPRADWISAQKFATQLVMDGQSTWDDLHIAVKAYAALCLATNRMVMNPREFFHAIDLPWANAWTIPEVRPRQPKPATRVAKTLEQIEAEEAANAKH